MTPTSGPAGTPVTIHLKGVGWTEYDNIYVANYDNAYMGYACGFNSQGDVTVFLPISGEPGWHPLTVRTRKKDYMVRARSGYIAGQSRPGSD